MIFGGTRVAPGTCSHVVARTEEARALGTAPMHNGESSRARASWLLCRLISFTVTQALGDDVNSTSTSYSTKPTLLLPTSASITTTTTTTTSDGFYSCGGVTRCLNETQCARCLSSINATRSFVHNMSELNGMPRMSLDEVRAYQVEFFETLLSIASCSTNATPPGILYPALQELGGFCSDEHGMAVSPCLLAEYVTVHCSLLVLHMSIVGSVIDALSPMHQLYALSVNPSSPHAVRIGPEAFDTIAPTYSTCAYMVPQVRMLCNS